MGERPATAGGEQRWEDGGPVRQVAAQPPPSSASSVGLTMGDLVERTGVPAATLRTWESRYGAPRPTRLPSGHRRFAEDDVGLVAEIARLRASGLALPAAIAHATATGQPSNPSVFQALLSRHPSLHIQVLRKRTLLTLTRAIEDECCTRAERPLLFAGFQQESYYGQSKERWQELARTADTTFVFADFERHSASDARPVRLALPETAPLRREWVVVCDDAEHPACVVATERPGQHRVPDRDRRFEAVWSLDPAVVRDAARTCAGVAASLQPGVTAHLADRLAATPSPATAGLIHAHGLFARVLGYLDTV